MAGETVNEIVLAAVRLIRNDDDVAPCLDRAGYVSPFSSGKNFWMVVNTTPPALTDSLLCRSARFSACDGG